ncbi:hypothetical protein H0A61_00685 [Koleobacter methoxysyntrophicus]|uniref:MrpA C-terminal/MbhD domain-containing protein n=1 Tax=Koleobacter methoxysyntrophicus TaxID=2751313 RepID=A0A8A0RJH4_9FIRM|nr:hydrogenase subunit MbhD domain-containing protein [Koleobacter methoxysyntrophicus]QSQ08363.1 hypothetical protein H0A61_00685 [Koleobacter methoxysyntrophicus]
MEIFNMMLLIILIACSIAVARTKNLLSAVVIFTGYSLIMAVLWQQLNAPDLAITEAAVGAGITTLLFIGTIKRTAGRDEK